MIHLSLLHLVVTRPLHSIQPSVDPTHHVNILVAKQQVDTRTVIPTTHATRTQTSLQTDEDHELHENARAERHNGASVNTSLRQIIKANDKTHSTRPRRRRLQGRVPGLGRRGSKSDGEGAGAGEAQPGFEGQREAGGGNTPVEGEDTGVEKLHDQDLSDPEQVRGTLRCIQWGGMIHILNRRMRLRC